jgi:hypothetical protein
MHKQGLACITDSVPYKEKLIYSSLLLPCFLAVLLVPVIWASLWYKQRPSAPDEDNKKRNVTRDKVWDYFYFSILFVTFTAYPAVSRNILSTFSCVQLGADGHFLRADMRITCPGPSDFSTIWAAVFTCLIPGGVPLALLLVMVTHGVPSLATKKRHLSLLEGLLQTFRRELSDADVYKLLEALDQVHPTHRNANEAMSPLKWLQLARGSTQDSTGDEHARVLRTVLSYTFPFGKTAITYKELICTVEAQRDALQYVPSNNFETPDRESILLVFLAFTVRKLGSYNRCAAERSSTSLYSLLHKGTRKPGKDDPSLENDNEDKEEWVKIFDNNIVHFKPQTSKEPDAYPCTIQARNVGVTNRRSFRNELAQQVYAQAEKMHSAKLLSVQEASWDASNRASQLERKMVMRLGFLFQSYRPSVWFFEVIEMVRKLVMASILIFVYDGTASQIVTGFVVTLVSLLLSLWLRPFNDDTLQGMHQWSLFVQSLTLLSGVMIKAEQFMEILGEKGGPGMTTLGIILVVLHFLVGVTPMLDKALQVAYMQYVALSRKHEGALCGSSAAETVEEGDASSHIMQQKHTYTYKELENLPKCMSPQDLPKLTPPQDPPKLTPPKDLPKLTPPQDLPRFTHISDLPKLTPPKDLSKFTHISDLPNPHQPKRGSPQNPPKLMSTQPFTQVAEDEWNMYPRFPLIKTSTVTAPVIPADHVQNTEQISALQIDGSIPYENYDDHEPSGQQPENNASAWYVHVLIFLGNVPNVFQLSMIGSCGCSV